jgi:ferritin-like metal-binding protein YciE
LRFLKSGRRPCEAIRGVLEEGEEIIEDYKDSPALDAGLLAAGQAVEHYEIARYGTLKNWTARAIALMVSCRA